MTLKTKNGGGVSPLLGRASSGNMGVKGTKGLRRWSQVVCLEVRATVPW